MRWRRLVAAIVVMCLVVPAYWGKQTQSAQAASLPVSHDLRVHGDFIVVGNGVLGCASAYACQQLLAGSKNQSYANDGVNMVYNDQDSNSDTYDSSSATLTVPSGAKIVYAEVVWSADTGNVGGSTKLSCGGTSSATVPTGSSKTQPIVFTGNGSTTSIAPASYSTDSSVTSGQPYYYSASADVTSQLASLPSGSSQTITVGNVWAPQGPGCYGGWALQVVYDYGTYVIGNAQSTLHEVYTYDTYSRMLPSSANATLNISNLNVQGTGSRFAAVGWEGDASITGDTVTYTTSSNTTSTSLPAPSDGATNNYFQSYADGSVPFPAYAAASGSKFYNASVSASASTLTNLVAGDTSLNITLATTQDSYLLTNAIVSVPVADATLYKTAANGEADQAVKPGTAPTYRFTIYNSGSVEVLNLKVDDPQAPDCNRTTDQLLALVQQTYPSGRVPAGGSVQYTCTGPATSTSLTNTATLTGQTPTGIPVGSSSSSKVLVANWTVTKAPSTPDVPVGGTATWNITVNNTGGADIYNVAVTDAALPGCNKTVALLQAGQNLTYTCTSTVTTTQTNTINVTGTAKASSTATITVPMTGTASGTVYTDAVTVQKSVDDPIVTVGGNATFSFKVTNTGTSTLNTVALNDPDFPACNQTNVGPLAAGATKTVTCTVTPFASASGNTLTNHVTATATPPSGNAVTATSQVNVDDAAIKLTKTAATTDVNGNGVLDAGDTVKYSFSVLNTGSVPMSSVAVADPKVSGITCSPTTLAAGATATCSGATYTVTQADVDAGTLVNTATATAQASDGTQATSTASVTLTPVQQPAIKLTKTASPTTVSSVGQVVTYTLTAANTGNTSLTGVSPADTLAGLSALKCTVGSSSVTPPVALAPGQSVVCTATRTTTQADLDAGKITNNASVSGTSPKGTVVNSTATAPVTATQTPSISVTKTGSATTFGAAGQTITYTYTLKNTGNVSVTGAQLNDPLARLSGKTCTPTQPTSLAPGATLTCTASLTVTQADVDGGAINNTVTGTATTPAGATLSQQASWVVTPATTPGLSLTKSPSRTSITAAGQAITYTFTATNTGNTTVSNVQVSDPLPGLVMGTCTPAAGSALAPGAKMSCSASYTSTQADVDAGQIVNTATVKGTDSHGTALSATGQATVTAAATPALTLSKSASPSVVNAVGQTVTYSFLLRNSGNVTLNNVGVTDALSGLSAISCPTTTLAPGASTTCTATRATTQADLNAGAVTNTATGQGTTPAGAQVTSPASNAKVTATQSPAFTITKSANPTSITAANTAITYSIVVTNSGNVTLTNLRVSDPHLASLSCSPVAAGSALDPGASTTCKGTYTSTQSDVNAGTINNTASATLTPPSGTDITNTASAVVTATRQPGLSLTKTGSTSTYTKAGDTITYTITAKNTGNVSLTSVQVTDPMFPASSPLSCTPSGAATLAPGDTITCTGQHAVTQAEVDAGTLTNTATVKGTTPSGSSVSATAPFTATATANPSVTLTKSANPTSINSVGRAITYTLVLTNTGNVTLSNAQISDPKITSFSSCSPALGSKLAPSATMTCTGTYTSTQADVDAGSIVNNATGQGTPPTGSAVTAPASTVVTVTQSATLTLTKSASPNRVNAVGQVVTYSFLVTNTGNVNASSLSLTDPMTGLSAISCPTTTLAPNASTTCTATRTTTQADLDQASGTVVNTATANAKQPNGQAFTPASGSATVQVTQTPKLTLTKQASRSSVAAVGDQVGYTLTLTNSGNVSVSNAQITDSMLTGMTCTPANGSTLAPGAAITCTGTHVTTQADIDVRSITNTASGAATGPNGQAVPGVTATAVVTATQNPSYTFTKSADQTTVNAVGQQITYSFAVTNTGNVTLGALTIADPHPGLGVINCPATTLAPGASTTCQARYTVTQSDLNSGSITNTATSSMVPPGGSQAQAITHTSSAAVNIGQAPNLSFSKTANATTYAATGRQITYTFAVQNTGNVDVTNVRVSDPLPGLSAMSCTPALGSTLAPQASMSCTATYTTTQADLDRTSIVNTATATGTAPDGSTLTRTATRTITGQVNPGLSFSKSANPASITAAGQQITYTFAVTNTGNVTMNQIGVSDTDLAGLSAVTCAATSLAPNASTTCTATYTSTQADVDRGSIANTATLSGTDPTGTVATRTANATVQVSQNPQLTLTKSATPTTVAAVGDQVSYTFHVVNSGNVTVSSVSITDQHAGLSAVNCPATTLAPGASTDCTATYTATQADFDNGHITNTATATGTAAGGASVTSPASTATVATTQNPSRTFTKTASPSSVNAVGQVVTYTLSVVNTGNVTLGSVYVSDPSHQSTQYSWTCTIYSTSTGTRLRGGTGPVSLAPGETKTCTALYTVSQADLDAGSILNTASTTGTDSAGKALPTLNSSAVVTSTQNPAMSFTKTADLTSYASVGQKITYTFVLMNTGNVTISNAQVNDPHQGLSALTCTPAMGTSLAPREQMKCTGTYTVTQADIDAGSINNSATGTATDAAGNPMSQTAAVTVPAALSPGISMTKVASPNPAATVGSTITYTFTVRNTGNDTLTGIAVTDPLAGLSAISCPTTTLAPGASTPCTATMTLTQAQADAAQVPNTATVNATDAGGTAVTAKASTTLRISQTPRLTLAKAASPSTVAAAGDKVTYTFTVTNSGNVSVNQIAINDPMLSNATLSCPQDSLAPGASFTCQATYTADQQDIDNGSINNTASVTGTTTSGAAVPTSQASATVTASSSPSLLFNKTADTTQVTRIGQTVTYTLSATNNGNVTLTNVFMSDPEVGTPRLSNCWVDHPDGSRTDAPGPVSLEPGATKVCHGARTFQQSDFQVADPNPATPGIDWTNTASITASAPDGSTVGPLTAQQTVYLQPSPDFQVTKSANTQSYSHAGQVITYTVQARNTGNVELANAHVTDKMLPAATLTCSPAAGSTLQPNQIMTCSGQYTVTQADVDAGSITNEAYGVGTDDQGVDHTSTQPGQLVVNWQGSKDVQLDKTANPAAVSRAGEVVTYTLTVNNPGDVTLDNVVVTDPLPGLSAVSCPSTQVAPGTSMNCTATYTITQADIDNSGVNNTATVKADAAGTTVTTTASTQVLASHQPSITLTKTAAIEGGKSAITSVGDVVDYKFLVTNTGNVALNNIAITDQLPVDNLSCPSSTLAPLAQMTCTATITITQAGLNRSSFDNQASVQGTDLDGDQVQAQSQVSTPTSWNPGLSLTKSASPTVVTTVGQTVTYTVAATNTGNVTLYNVFVADPIPGLSKFDCGALTGPATVQPGQTKTCTATRQTTQADLDAGTINNTANVTSVLPNGQTGPRQTASAVVQATQNPHLSVTKTVDQPTYSQVGDQLGYTITTTNDGNVSLANVQVSDSLPGITDLTCDPVQGSTLAPNESMTCTGDYAVTQADIDARSVTNTAHATAVGPNIAAVDADSAPVVSNAELSSSISLSKTADTTSYDTVGQVVTYTMTATNTGNSTLSGVTITDQLAGVSALSCDQPQPATLAPKGTLVCTGTYTITQADLDDADVLHGVGLTNPASVTGADTAGTQVNANAQVTIQAFHNPKLVLTKVANPTTFDSVGQMVNYTFTIANTGNVLMHNIKLSDPLLTNATCPTDVLEAGAQMTCTGSLVTDQHMLDSGSVPNTASVHADDVDNSKTADAQASAVITATQNPDITLAKSGSPATVTTVGQQITFTVVATNTGNVTLGNVFIADPIPNHTTFACTITQTDGGTRNGTGPVSLEPGEVKTCHATYAVTQADIDNGTIPNTANVTAAAANGQQMKKYASWVTGVTQQPSLGVTKSVDQSSFSQVGQKLTYSIAVTNTGNTTASNVQVADSMNLDGLSCTPQMGSNLASGAVMNCTGTHTVTQADLDAKGLTNVANVSASDPTGNPVTATSNPATSTATLNPSMTLHKTASPSTVDHAGQVVTYTFEATNTGNATLQNVVLNDPMAGLSTPDCSPASAPYSIAPGDTLTCTATYTVTQDDIDKARPGDGLGIHNDATTSGSSSDGQTATAAASADVTVKHTPQLSLAKSVSPTHVSKVGTVVTYSFVITNTGNVVMSHIQLTDPLPNLGAFTCDQPLDTTQLEPGATITCTAPRTVQQAGIDAGHIDNTASVSGTDPDGEQSPTTTSSATLVTDQSPAMTLEKSANVTTVNAVGDMVVYTVTMTNTGNTTLSNVFIADPLPGHTTFSCTITAVNGSTRPGTGPVTVYPGERKTCTTRRPATQADLDAGSINNTANVTAQTPQGTAVPIVYSNPVTVVATQQPAIQLVKSVTPTRPAKAGDTLTYSFTISNPGTVTLGSVKLSDPMPGLSDFTCDTPLGGSLAPGDEIHCTATKQVTADEMNQPVLDNTATATATTPDSAVPTVTSQSSAEAVPVHHPSLSLTKTHDVSEVTAAGQTVNFTFTVTNTGNIAVENVAIADAMAGVSTPTCQATTLAVGASTTCTATYTTTQADLDRGSITNTATATGVDTLGGDPVTPGEAQDQVTVTQNPRLTITKTPITPAPVALGDDAQFKIVATNAGNTTLTNVRVDDPAVDLTALDCTPAQGASLAPHETMTCTAHLQVTQTQLDAGVVDNTASVTGQDPSGATLPPVSDQAQIKTVVGTADATFTKTSSPATATKAGDTITYTFTVKNTGTLSLFDPRVSDPMPGLMNLSCDHDSGSSLAPGATMTCTATYTLTQADADAGKVTNTAGFDALVPPSDTPFHRTASNTTPVTQSPALSVSKTADRSQVTAAGDTITYTFDVRNTGNVSVAFEGVNDVLPIKGLACVDASGTSVSLPSRLAPQEQLVCQATYAVTQADLDAGSITNSATSTGHTDLNQAVTSPPASTVVTANQNPAIEMTKTADTSLVQKVGDKVTYTITARNSGNVTVSNATITDPANYDSFTCTPAKGSALAPGQTMTCTGVYTVIHDDLVRGHIANTADFRGTDPNGTAVTGDAGTTVPALYNPKITFVKSVSAPQNWLAGDRLDYTFTVTNTGNMDAYDFVNNDKLSDIVLGSCEVNGEQVNPYTDVLHPGSTAVCTGYRTATQADADAGQVTNAATVIAHEVTGQAYQPVTSTATTTTDLTGSMSVTKGSDVATYDHVGAQVTYSVDVTNTGPITLSGFRIDDPMAGLSAFTCPKTSLAPTASMTCTATYTVTQADLDRGVIDNTVSVTASDPHGKQVGAVTASHEINAETTASLALTKQAQSSSVSKAGDLVQFTLTAENTGTVTLHNITLTDQLAGTTITGCDRTTPATLAPGEVLHCTVDYHVTQDDMNRGRVLNTAVADALDPHDQPITEAPASSTVPAQRQPGVSLTKSPSVDTVDAVGQQVTYTFVVTNTGNTSLFNTRVSDPLPGLGTPTCSPEAGSTLDPGQTMTCTAPYTVTLADMNAGVINNTATVRAENLGGDPNDPSDDVTNQASATVTATSKPALTLTKSANVPTVNSLTSTIVYTFHVTNSGNVTLHGVTVSDPLTAQGMSPIDCPEDTLDPGQSMDCQASFHPAQTDLDRGYIPNTATAKGLDPKNEPAEPGVGSARVAVAQSPAMSLSKTADHTLVTKVGERVLYTMVGTNTGNVTLHVVKINDPMPGLEPMDCYPRMPADLPPGANVICRAWYSVTQADLDQNTVSNTATMTADDPSGNPVPPADATETIQTVVHSQLDIVKSSSDLTYSSAGDVLHYTLTVSNNGNQTVHDVVVSDLATGASPVVCTDTDGTHTMPDETLTIVPDTSVQCTVTYSVTQADLDKGSFTNTAQVSGTGADNQPIEPVQGTLTTTATQTPGLTMAKSVTPDSVSASGQQVTWTITATNSGNTTLHGLTIADPLKGLGDLQCPSAPADTVLAPGDVLTCTATYTTTQADVDAGSVRNPVTGTALTPSNTQVEESASATLTLPQSPSVSFTKTADTAGPVKEGGTIHYTLVVTNTGNVTAQVASIDDPMAGTAGSASALTCDPALPSAVAPGATLTCHLAHVVTTDEAMAGSVSNTATVAVSSPGGKPITVPPSTSVMPTTATPAMTLSKRAVLNDANHNGTGQPGETIDYTIVATNTGNTTLRGVTVSDPMFRALSCSTPTPASLAPGAKLTCTGRHTITASEAAAGHLVNTATLVSKDIRTPVRTQATVPTAPAPKPVPPVHPTPPTQPVPPSQPWNPDVPTLPNTGSPVSWWMLVLGFGCTLAGGLMLARRRRHR